MTEPFADQWMTPVTPGSKDPPITGGHEYEFVVDSAQSTQTCSDCSSPINVGSLQVSHHGDADWKHIECVLKDVPALNVQQMRGVESLSSLQRKELLSKLSHDRSRTGRMSLSKLPVAFVVEHARCMTDECCYCGEEISSPSELRMGSLRWRRGSLLPRWYHFFCFFRSGIAGKDIRSDDFAGCSRLEKSARKLLDKLIFAHNSGYLKITKKADLSEDESGEF